MAEQNLHTSSTSTDALTAQSRVELTYRILTKDTKLQRLPPVISPLGERLHAGRATVLMAPPPNEAKKDSADPRDALKRDALFTIPLDWDDEEAQVSISSDQPVVYLNASVAETSREILLALNKNRLLHMNLELLRRDDDRETTAALVAELAEYATDVGNFLESCLASIPKSLRTGRK